MKPGSTPKPESRNGFQVEIDILRKEFARVSLQLQQQETFISHLKEAEIRKDDAIAQMESEFKSLQQLHAQEISVIVEESQTKHLEAEHKIRFLELEVAKLREESKLDNHFEEENKALRQTLLEQQQQVELLQRRVVDLQSRATDDPGGDTRQQLEEEFKRRLTEAESKYQTDAYRALSEEAKLALQGNDHLQTILSRQNDSIQNVLNRCKLLESSHSKLKTEQELSLQSLRMHQAEVQKLRKQLTDSKSRCQQLEEDLNQRRIERASLELLFIEYEKSQREMQRLQERLRRAQRQADRWRNRVILLQQELGSESRMHAKLNMTTDGAIRRAAARQWESRGTDSSDDEGENDTLSGEAPPSKVDPMEILAMWNVNFEHWKPAGLDESRASAKPSETPARVLPATLEPPQKARPTADQVRLERDRELSVLSKGKAGAKGGKTKAAAEPHQFSVAEGQIQFSVRPSGYKGLQNARFLVP
eukprot:GGOE01036826.1.p1 GENE.GGOE01036826.1~~GGOE01036826.1.p1  ORF type:complete len:477 (+),score=98.56 GGOE01036826.1:71-1501(+)